MCGMKRDMGGAAAILHAFVSAAKLQPADLNLTAILCLAENSVGMGVGSFLFFVYTQATCVIPFYWN